MSIVTAFLLTTKQMAAADAATIAAGTSGSVLMDRAGTAVARAIWMRWPRCSVTVLCGPGNNGGDGFVAARRLKDAGYTVRVALLGDRGALAGDAAGAAGQWTGPVERFTLDALTDTDIVVDAVFGAGLTRPVEDIVADMLTAVAEREIPVVAVDVPSGIDGNTGVVRGIAAPAAVTVTFASRKPGHLLMPGRLYCGETIVADIGIAHNVLADSGVDTWDNGPMIWGTLVPMPMPEGHKYDRGHVLVRSGRSMTGAARLVAEGARRAGAGLVTVAADPEAAPIIRSDRAGVMVATTRTPDRWDRLLSDPRRNAIVIGPGVGVGVETRGETKAALATGRPTVIDADALTSFSEERKSLFASLTPDCVLTPHEGEFERLFGVIEGDKLFRARTASRRAGAVVVLKGADTIIAHPEGPAIINGNAPPWLATAGSGDVLAGIIAGFLGQGMEGFLAAAAAVWVHGAAARLIGPGLVAEDLPNAIPDVLNAL